MVLNNKLMDDIINNLKLLLDLFGYVEMYV